MINYMAEKLRKWDEVGDEFTEKIPKNHEVVLIGLDKESYCFNPTVKINNFFSIVGKCDLTSDNVYGICLHYKDIQLPLPSDLLNFIFDKDVQNFIEETYTKIIAYNAVLALVRKMEADVFEYSPIKNDNEPSEGLKIKSSSITNLIRSMIDSINYSADV
ncbi:MAG: hypothetical protein L3I99_05745 [Sulfurimonas sp.]|nr:hypothetical protein [Sulfurimonas sp.]